MGRNGSNSGCARRIRVVLADDFAIAREGMAQLLAAEPDFAVVGEAGDRETALRVTLEQRPDILLLDLGMHRLDGIQVARQVRARLPGVRIVVLAGHEIDRYAPEIARLGVEGYLTKASSARELIGALRSVQAGEGYVSSEAAEALLRTLAAGSALAVPTERELEVLRLVEQGWTNRAVAQRLALTPRTVEFHLSRLFDKLGASSRTELVHLARQRGWIA